MLNVAFRSDNVDWRLGCLSLSEAFIGRCGGVRRVATRMRRGGGVFDVSIIV